MASILYAYIYFQILFALYETKVSSRSYFLKQNTEQSFNQDHASGWSSS